MARALVFAAALALGLAAESTEAKLAGSAPNTRIVGGTVVPVSKYPFVVSLQRLGLPQCGGALISDRVVATAAHCVVKVVGNTVFILNEEALEVVSGQDRIFDTPSATHEARSVRRLEVFPGYNHALSDSDIALLELSLPFNGAVPIQPAQDTTSEAEGTVNKVIGWGAIQFEGPSSNDLQEVEVSIVARADCNDVYNSRLIPNRISSNMICAGSESGGKDACQGDSGGPLFNEAGTARELVGIVSFGRECGLAAFPGVYTRVSEFSGFIQDFTSRVSNNDAANLVGAARCPNGFQTIDATPDGSRFGGNYGNNEFACFLLRASEGKSITIGVESVSLGDSVDTIVVYEALSSEPLQVGNLLGALSDVLSGSEVTLESREVLVTMRSDSSVSGSFSLLAKEEEDSLLPLILGVTAGVVVFGLVLAFILRYRREKENEAAYRAQAAGQIRSANPKYPVAAPVHEA